jgi:hypothetical protein
MINFLHLPRVFLPNSPLTTSKMFTNYAHVIQHEMDIIIFSNFDGVFVFPHLEDVQIIFLHIDLAYVFSLIYLCCTNCVVKKT